MANRKPKEFKKVTAGVYTYVAPNDVEFMIEKGFASTWSISITGPDQYMIEARPTLEECKKWIDSEVTE